MKIRTSRSEFPSDCFLIKSKARESYTEPEVLLCKLWLSAGPQRPLGLVLWFESTELKAIRQCGEELQGYFKHLVKLVTVFF